MFKCYIWAICLLYIYTNKCSKLENEILLLTQTHGLVVLKILCTPCCAVLSHLVVSDSWRHYGLQPTRLPCPWGFSRQEYCSGLPCPPPGDPPNPGIEPRSPTLLADSLLSELPGKPTMYLTNANNYKEWKPGFSLLEKGFTHIEIKDQILCCSGIEGLV